MKLMEANQSGFEDKEIHPSDYLIENAGNEQWNLHLVIKNDMKDAFRKERLSCYLDKITYLNIGTYSSEEEVEFIVHAAWEELKNYII
ncbi:MULTISPECIES: hypothetical protein [Bacillus]|uniref:hypothetical protein n=1 Tax=Bacillus TaxID=1386 RepID=UPI00033121EF|nr:MULTISPECIES: hypothetical protein [Bacillus cereus group]EOP60419.1 hypothetical protein IIW_04454 [Bacillus cereus VD136]EOP70820.1 hypothetical protein KOW_04837 [Bacillus cereus VDM006]EOQ05766.1 hypothetical protein KOY_03994 [Bacillus cereus VDM021]OOG91598.1 hypothetical protein BTH41_01370 [Bacillus mycoides]MDF2085329.1 hypothetical protein [Bacillus pseudomycoides]